MLSNGQEPAALPTGELERLLRRNDLPLRDQRLIETEYRARLAREYLGVVRGGGRQIPAGWYDDRRSTTLERYWDGNAWTDQTRPKPRRRGVFGRG